MIYLGFVFDYFINTFLPINSYFCIANIENNNIFEVIVIGIILDTLLGHYLFNLIIIMFLYFIAKRLKTKKKYKTIQNIIIYSIYFFITNLLFGRNLNIFVEYVFCLFLQLLYLYISNLLINNKVSHII